MKNVENLRPRAFTRFCMSIGAVPSSYLSGLTIEEQILWFCSYLENKVIPVINNNGEALTELQNLYTELKDYVDNYFDNLDVTEAISDKLDEMAQDGTLAALLDNNQYVFATQTQMLFENGASLKTQGIAKDDNYIYMCENGEYPNGSIKKYNINDKSYVATYSGLQIYEGVDCTILGNYMYIAGGNTSGNPTKKIARFNIVNNSMESDINPFSAVSDMQYIGGITKYDTNHLICSLTKTNEDMSNTKFYMLDIRNNSYEEITINTNGFDLSYYQSKHGIEYKDGYIYMTTSDQNSFITFKLINDNASALVVNVHFLPFTDRLGQYYGQIRGITSDENDIYISSRCQNNEFDTTEVVKFYKVGINSLIPPLTHNQFNYAVNGERNWIIVDNTSSALMEDGTLVYPYKSLDRAIVSENGDYPIPNVIEIAIEGGTNYSLHKIDNETAVIETRSGSNVTIDLTNCYIDRSSVKIIKQSGVLTVTNLASMTPMPDHSELYIHEATVPINSKLSMTYGSLGLIKCNITSTINNDYLILLYAEGTLDLTGSTTTANSTSKWYKAQGGGKIVANYNDYGHIDHTETARIDYPSAKNFLENVTLESNFKLLNGQYQGVWRDGETVVFNLALQAKEATTVTSDLKVATIPAHLSPGGNVLLIGTIGFGTGSGYLEPYVNNSDHSLKINTSRTINANEVFTIHGSYIIPFSQPSA